MPWVRPAAMRMPVKDPGPHPKAIASIAAMVILACRNSASIIGNIQPSVLLLS